MADFVEHIRPALRITGPPPPPPRAATGTSSCSSRTALGAWSPALSRRSWCQMRSSTRWTTAPRSGQGRQWVSAPPLRFVSGLQGSIRIPRLWVIRGVSFIHLQCRAPSQPPSPKASASLGCGDGMCTLRAAVPQPALSQRTCKLRLFVTLPNVNSIPGKQWKAGPDWGR